MYHAFVKNYTQSLNKIECVYTSSKCGKNLSYILRDQIHLSTR